MISPDAVADEELEVCHHLRTVCDLPVHVNPAGRIAVTIGSAMRGLTTPKALGEDIRAVLKDWDLLGPVIWHRSERYTFLARYSPDVESNGAFCRALLRTNSQLIPVGGVVALPSFDLDDLDDTDIRKWVHPPRDMFRPSTQTLLEALLECEPRVKP
ncbi:hypothetical protein [Nocardia sp. CS682]|uniref:hypothetical protein n=1 Tax=Nocardia sp. CS682 TaxID=1047172 RepID=UPI0010758CA4|nr:hypothetical protein [Nocardia sp. CS682]